MKTLNELKDATEKVASKMPNTKKWGAHQRMVELMEEVGELANAIQTTEGYKTQNRQKSEVVDSICDVLYEIFCIATIYKVDLDNEYPKVLQQIDDRRKSGEFDL